VGKHSIQFRLLSDYRLALLEGFRLATKLSQKLEPQGARSYTEEGHGDGLKRGREWAENAVYRGDSGVEKMALPWYNFLYLPVP
jgi:hypothetical protein